MNNKVVEIIQYSLKPGTGIAFHEIMQTESIPLHQRAGLDIVAYGCSLHNQDNYYLIRQFDSLTDLGATLDAFYQSDAWKQGPRLAIVSLIVTSMKTVLPLTAASQLFSPAETHRFS